MNYLVWGHAHDDTLCSLNPIENVPDAHELVYGTSRVINFPKDALGRMNPEFKRAIKLSDAIHNLEMLVIASKRLKEFFESEKIPNTEYLRIAVLNHKNKVASDEYYVVHQVGTQACIDIEKSTIRWNKINPNQISSVKKLVLDEKKIEPSATLFRATHLPSTIFIRRDLAKKIEEAGFTGIQFEEVDTYRKV